MDSSEPASSAFAVVYDVAASWQDYHLIGQAVGGPSVPGLILHAAGPTQDGFRTIDVWASEADWLSYRPRLRTAFDDLAEPPVIREMHIGHLVSVPPVPAVSPAPSLPNLAG